MIILKNDPACALPNKESQYYTGIMTLCHHKSRKNESKSDEWIVAYKAHKTEHKTYILPSVLHYRQPNWLPWPEELAKGLKLSRHLQHQSNCRLSPQTLWVNLNPHKAMEPDDLHSQILKKLASVVTPILQIIFNTLLTQEKSHFIGRKEMLAQSSRKASDVAQQLTDPWPWRASASNYWNI